MIQSNKEVDHSLVGLFCFLTDSSHVGDVFSSAFLKPEFLLGAQNLLFAGDKVAYGHTCL